MRLRDNGDATTMDHAFAGSCALRGRKFIAAIFCVVATVPAIAQDRVAKVGWMSYSESGMFAEATQRGYVRGLREAGFVEGRNLAFVRRYAGGDLATLKAQAREIVAERVDAIFAPAKPMVDAAWYASRRIPTIIATVTDPVLVQYAESLSRPGKHITGVTTANENLIGKRLELLKELLPQARRIAVILDPDLVQSCEEELRLMEKAAQKLGIGIERLSVPAGRREDYAAAVARVAASRVDALITAPMSVHLDATEAITELVARHRIPLIHDVPQLAGNALAVYGPDFEDIFRRAGHYTGRVLKGERPAEMAIEQPKEFRLVVNARVARTLGVKIPNAVLLRANEVIE